ncbi:MAG: SurA N-terminal domain-containing protein [Cyclobacteriaceae bacterium]|nr:SurA N-terminal domain-containing protein [Cyclobacteriaceae bacterium]
MAVMNTLRNKMGKIVLIAIGFAMVAFIAGDLIGSNSFLFGSDNNVGEIAGKTVSYEEYQRIVENLKIDFSSRQQRNPTENELSSLRQQAWDRLISDIAFGQQMDEVGVLVTEDEVWDVLQGKNVDQGIAQDPTFINPETGLFDGQLVVNYINQVAALADNHPAKTSWINYESNVAPGRKRVKFDNLMVLSSYATEAEAQKDYNLQNDVAEVKYIYVPFYSVPDSVVEVSDNMLQNYLNENKNDYKVEQTRTMDYVSFPVFPSSEDSAYVRESLNELREEFKTISDDSIYAKINSDMSNFYGTYNISNLPASLLANVSNLTTGDVRGAYLENNYYKLYKVVSISEDTVGTTKASHILFKWDADTDEAKAVARKKANGVLSELKNGANFAEKANEHGTDGTKTRGGDLGWFTEGRKMVKEFDDAVFAQKGKGLINKLVETQFGYHIIELTEDISYLSYNVATIAHEIIPSDETRNKAFVQADLFASLVNDASSFKSQAEADNFTIQSTDKLEKNDRNVGNLEGARQIVQWLFRDARKGKVSDVFDLDNDYVVAIMTGEEEEGTSSLDNVKTRVALKVKNNLKSEIIITNLNKLSGSLDEIAEAYGSDANVYTSSDLKLNASTLPSVTGLAPEAVGIAFGLQSGERSAAISVDQGVIIIEVLNRTTAPEIGDYTIYTDQLKQRQKSKVSFNITEAIKEHANIKDERYKFY